jgi:Phasin protein
MSETTRKPGEDSGRDQIAQAARQTGERGADAAKRSVDTSADATRRTAELTADAAQRAADQGREATIAGLRAVAGIQGPLADAGFEQSRRALETTSGMTEVYRQGAERAADDVRALFESWMSLGRGLQQWQQAYFDAVRQSMDIVSGKRRDLGQTDSPRQFAEVQRDLYVDLVNSALRGSTTLLQLTAQIAQEAVRPLQERARART